GVEADAQAVLGVGELDDLRQLLEAPAQRRALAGGVLQQHARVAGLGAREDGVERPGDELYTRVDAGAEVAARVEDEAAQPQPVAAGELVREARHGGAEYVLLGRSEVDQVGRVGDDRAPRLAVALPERRHV